MISTNLLLLGVIICQLSLFIFALVLIKKQISSLSASVLSYFAPKSEKEQSSFADTLDLIASRFGSAVVASLKGFLMAENSAAIRQDKAAARTELLATNPLLGFAAKYAPGIIRKNPELAQLAMSLFQGKGPPGPAEGDNGHRTSSSEDPFKI